MNENKELAIVFLLKLFIFLLLEVQYFTDGAVVISPSPRVEVCHIGERLEVMCYVINSTESILQWDLMFISEIGGTTHLTEVLSSSTVSESTRTLESIRLTFSRYSELRVLPLASTLVIDSVQDSLNGTSISCRTGNNMATSADTTVFIVGINSDYYHPNTPVVDYEEDFGTFTITVSLWWTNAFEHSLVTYHVYVTPSNGVTIGNSSKTRANVTLSYNTQYVVNVEANFCGLSNATANIELNYAKVKCGKVMEEELDNSTVIVSGYRAPLEGAVVIFTCADGLILTGPNSSTCMSNGRWEPHPREVKCKENCSSPYLSEYTLPYTSTLEGANVSYVLCDGVHFTATCNRNGNWEPNFTDVCNQPSVTVTFIQDEEFTQDVKIAVGSSVTVSIVCSVLFFIVGFVCGHFCHKQKQSVEAVPPLEETPTPSPLYDDIQPRRNEEEVELKTNVAYAPVNRK